MDIFGDFSITWSSLVQSFYIPLVSYAAEPATVEVDVLLSAADMLQLLATTPSPISTPRILCPVFIGGEIGSYFKIRSINFVPNSDIQRATLIRL